MADGERVRGKDIIGKVIVSEESGRKFGIVGDVAFITESGELMNLVVTEPTKGIQDLGLSEDDKGRLLIPFSAVKSVGDFIIIAEKDII
ncbi:MAG: PRC-barrel domain-containing protein [Candidatus Aenigmatarchaeota archaeon]|nr:PRC-barrel domain-containing protein [Candidatus Aenigmarchaeota archaeon]